MNKIKKILAIICAFVMITGLVACGSTKQTSVVGTWVSDTGKISEITFSEDGTGNLKKSSEISVSMTYSVDGDKLTVTTDILGQKSETTYTYAISNGKLTLTSGSDVIELSKQ
jgi:uncharacterized lipoprotein YehR (DUF1307 family)